MSDDAILATREIRDGDDVVECALPGIKLTVLDGPDKGQEAVARRGTLRVGNAPDNDLVLTDDAVSRHHLEIRLRPNEVRIADRRSTNGTEVNGVRVVEAVLKPGQVITLGKTTLRVSAVSQPVMVPMSKRHSFGGLLGRSPAMRQAFAILERVAASDVTVLVDGETGTGKELAAEALHQESHRADGPFVAVDCGAITPTLVESHLFGHVAGAFTGATADRRGAFEEADGGTVFLDEIGELPLEMQPKLLRALESRTYRRLGESQMRPFDARIVAATNRDLAAEVNRGTFREDLYFRLAVIRVTLPPLRSRGADVAMLVEHFVKRFAPSAGALDASTLQSFASQPWPGNVRELRNAVERACALAAPVDTGDITSAEISVSASQQMSALFGLPIKEAVETWTEAFERAYLENALRICDGSVSEVARRSGVNRRFVQRMMKRLGVRAQNDGE